MANKWDAAIYMAYLNSVSIRSTIKKRIHLQGCAATAPKARRVWRAQIPGTQGVGGAALWDADASRMGANTLRRQKCPWYTMHAYLCRWTQNRQGHVSVLPCCGWRGLDSNCSPCPPCLSHPSKGAQRDMQLPRHLCFPNILCQSRKLCLRWGILRELHEGL